MADARTPKIPRDQLLGLLDGGEKRTVQMAPLQLQHLLLPERTTANLVVLLDKPKRHPRHRHQLAIYCLLAIVFFLLGFYLA